MGGFSCCCLCNGTCTRSPGLVGSANKQQLQNWQFHSGNTSWSEYRGGRSAGRQCTYQRHICIFGFCASHPVNAELVSISCLSRLANCKRHTPTCISWISRVRWKIDCSYPSQLMEEENLCFWMMKYGVEWNLRLSCNDIQLIGGRSLQ